ncbi:helix-hairpin-helix domain-containing protein [Streptomyces chryseus]|uniref:helix-hairpin-helix domain-containing protein n=2 Tax=Streptomyces chryseus TaxID=68186 RepID=UPI001FCA73EB|nr:helix-hairpin-helix domain-containing protein [Streptomyces chryseus]
MTALPRGATPGSPADDRDAAAPATEPAPTPAVPVRGPAGDVEKPRTGPVTATGADAPDDADAAEHPKDATEDAGTDVQHDDNTPQPDAETAPAGADDEAPDAGAPSGEGGDGAAEASGPVAGAEDEEAMGSGPDAEPGEAVAGADAEATGAGPDAEPGEAVAGADAGPQLSEAEAELAAQRALRERIERRKAEKTAPVEAGAKLSGQAADLLAAVRAVEGGARSGDTPFAAPPPRRVAPAPPPGPGAGPAVERPADRAAVAAAAPEAVTAVRGVLAEGGAPEALAASVAGVLGEQAAQVLRDDPWQLLSVPGVRPEQADGFARALLGAECGPGDERRTAALIGRLLERAAVQGHTVLESGAVRKALAEHKVPDPDEAVEHAVAEGVALVFQDGVDETADGGEPVEVLLGLERYALAEESLADGLARLASTFADEASEAGEWGAGSVPPSAAELIRAVASNGLVTHSGGEAARSEPAALVTVARGLGLRAYAASHSADGRRRLGAALGDASASVTVAGLLAGVEGPGRDAEGALALDLLVVLDAPQLDVENAAVLVESLADGTRLVLSGDPGVLPSAGAGRVFADLLAARACPQIVSRTPDPGPIGELVSGIGIGELNQVEAPGKEVVIVPVRDAGEAVHRTVQLVADSVPRAFGVSPAQTQVITPGHGGSAGTRALNAALKQRLNPGPGRFGGFDPGDRVAYVPAPGRTLPGTVVSADAEGLHLDCEGTPVVVPKERVETAVRHAWALTAHQATGMRWPAVVVVLPGDAAPALSRPWIYTAFSRGERHLSVVHGVDQALPRAVAEIPDRPRTTRLRTLLQPPVQPLAEEAPEAAAGQSAP